ncbi:hypothetical protein ACJROX_15235 [Pseudalkalibacillus sp. A8]
MDELLYLIALIVGLVGVWSIYNYSKQKRFAIIQKKKRNDES